MNPPNNAKEPTPGGLTVAEQLFDDNGTPIVCLHCQLPITVGEARYTGGESADPPRYQHWDCHDRWVTGIETDLKAFRAKHARALGMIRQLRDPLWSKKQ